MFDPVRVPAEFLGGDAFVVSKAGTPTGTSPLGSPKFLQLSLALQSASSSEVGSPFELIEKDITTMDPDLEAPSDTLVDNELVEVPVTRDPEYYMDTVVFKVEDSLYRVPAHLFRSSTDFFIPQLDASKPQGEDALIELSDVTKADFRALLKFLYPLTFILVRTHSDTEWISILKLSTKWKMLDIRRIAIEHLSSAPLTLVERIVLAKECSIVSWLRSAYATLIDVNSKLSSLDETAMEKIGLESTFKLHRAREYVIPQPETVTVMRKKIEKEFEDELRKLGNDTAIERAMLAKTYNVLEWRESSFIELVSRDQILTVDEAKTLGIETAICLCGARELQGSLGVTRAVKQELKWDFGALESHSAVKRVVMARDYAVGAWILGALRDLGKRPESLSTLEAMDLGLNTAIALCRARHNPNFPSSSDEARRTALEREFGEELAELEAKGSQLLSKLELEELKELELRRLELEEEKKRLEIEEKRRLELEEKRQLELEEKKRLEIEEKKRLERFGSNCGVEKGSGGKKSGGKKGGGKGKKSGV